MPLFENSTESDENTSSLDTSKLPEVTTNEENNPIPSNDSGTHRTAGETGYLSKAQQFFDFESEGDFAAGEPCSLGGTTASNPGDQPVTKKEGVGNRDALTVGNAPERLGGVEGKYFLNGRSNGDYLKAHSRRLKKRRQKREKNTSQPLFEILDRPKESPREASSCEAPSSPPSLPKEGPSDNHGNNQNADTTQPAAEVARSEKDKALDILFAIRILNRLDDEQRPATPGERVILRRFGGFGAVALRLFPDPATGRYKDSTWRKLGEELKSLLSPADYDSAKRTTFNAFYTSPTVMRAMHDALSRLGVPDNALVLEPGCGIGNFIGHSIGHKRFIGVELDRTSGRIAKALYPDHDIRIEDFRDSRLPENRIDAVIGNVPFANISLAYRGTRFSLHDYFFAKSIDALKPGGVLALVTSHFTLDKQNAAIREHLAERGDFLGAIRLPAEAFKRQGTKVVTDIVFFRKRAAGESPQHVDSVWLETAPFDIEGTRVYINRYFHRHQETVLGDFHPGGRLYSSDVGYTVSLRGDLAERLRTAIRRLPKRSVQQRSSDQEEPAPPFVPSPSLPHLTEGSFFVGEDRTIRQVVSGEAIPVTHGATVLNANRTKLGKRLSALIELRDGARRVLQSQNEGWPENHREATRRMLAWNYDRFVAKYGPINKTTLSHTQNGGSIRRMPNLVKFREDPDAMLVMALEVYDEATGKATKAAILSRDVVGKRQAVTSVKTAEEGLLVSLDHRGGVDLPYISALYGKSTTEVTTELGDLIYLNPESNAWETADMYLSGNVREKLAVALQAGPAFEQNAKALTGVQPPDILPGEIDANLGAPWIPTAVIQAFAATLFRVAPSSVQIGHLKKDAVWIVDSNYAATHSVAATGEFGTERANGVWLFELALNMKTPVIYDTIHTPEGDQRLQNQEETLAAREKQKLIKERFRVWVFEEPDRTERLVRIYNDTYNNLRLRLFDGAHLDFPGMSQTISLQSHQKNAVWRGMTSGNTLLAHVVGAGKTFTMAATGMKLKQAGLIQKPMYVVPNHMLEQFTREFMQLYPNAKLLLAAKEDLTRDRRKRLTARIASGRWDGVIVTHSSFERIGMSAGYQERFLREQIEEYDLLLCEAAADDTSRPQRNLLKTIEKQKAGRKARLDELLAKEKKDDGLVFDELGVDHIFIDEAHYFKNLETPTKMNRVAGIQTGGSQRAFDLFMKARFLGERHTGHGVTFATGTPISNTMVELYTVQRFLDPKGLADRGIEHFDAWAATFGEVVEAMEISPDGSSLRPRSRFARFNNLPELQQLFRAFADVQTADMLDLPRPGLKGGKPVIVACPMSSEQCDLQEGLVKRYEQLRSQKVDPRDDNALAITTDGRKLALDPRMLTDEAKEDAHSKINTLVAQVTRVWRDTAAVRGTQLVFCDMGVKATSWGYCAYRDVIGKLVASGIPREQIATMGEANSDPKKQSLFERVRNGSVRVLIGSTTKMGTGTNVQKRLVALHHLDAPWKPAEVEQREGRILRQGNDNKEVEIYRYVTEGSFDAFMWQALETKARFIAQVITGDNALRQADDIGGQELSYAEVKAIDSGNPAVLTLAEADAELGRLAVLRKNHLDQQFLTRRKIRELPETISRLTERKENLEDDQATLATHAKDVITIGGESPDDVLATLGQRLERLPASVSATRRIRLGMFCGLNFGVMQHPVSRPDVFLQGAATRSTSLSREIPGPRAVLNALERLAASYAEEVERVAQNLTLSHEQLRDYETQLGKPFVHEHYLGKLAGLRDQLKKELSSDTPSKENEPASIYELARQIKELQSGHTVSAAPERPQQSHGVQAEEPVTTRLWRRIERMGASGATPSVLSDDSTGGW